MISERTSGLARLMILKTTLKVEGLLPWVMHSLLPGTATIKL
jgi:hypothetical protein